MPVNIQLDIVNLLCNVSTAVAVTRSTYQNQQELKKRNIRDVVRACEPTYRTDILEKEGIQVHDLQFADGFPPPQHIIDQWFELCRTRFREDSNACIAVHCVAGLGRAPVLVALALIELGMPYEDSVDLIRQKRRGAINARQLSYLAEYRPKSRLKVKYRQTNGCLLQ